MSKCKLCNNKSIKGFDICFDCYLNSEKNIYETIIEERELNKNVFDRY